MDRLPAYHPARQFAIQGAAAIGVLSLAWPYYGMAGKPYDWPVIVVLIGVLASLIARVAGQAWWWRIIHLFFAPLAWLVAQWNIDPGWFLLGFFVLFLLFRGAISGQVPLYLSSRAATDTLADLIEARDARVVIDLGAGIGSAVVPLARMLPDRTFIGIEYSPLSYAIGWLRTRGLRNVTWRYQDFWQTPLGEADLVYVFLSPAPMSELGDKAAQEMRPGSLLVSNSFPAPGQIVTETLAAGERTLFCYAAERLQRHD